MTKQSEALRLADALAAPWLSQREVLEGAAELRRLHAENAMLHQRHHDDNVEYMRVLAQRDQLLRALHAMLRHLGMEEDKWNKPTFDQARAAIKAVEGEKT